MCQLMACAAVLQPRRASGGGRAFFSASVCARTMLTVLFGLAGFVG